MIISRFWIFLVLTLIRGAAVFAQDVTGLWQTIDDRSGEAKAVVRVYLKDGRLYGDIEKILVEGKEDAVCVACEGEKANQPIRGMTIIKGLERTGVHSWEGDQDSLFDPEQGKSFRSRIWLDPARPDQLKVRGYWLFFYRTQTWKRLKETK